MINICTKLGENILNGFRFMERTRFVMDRQTHTDEQTDVYGKSNISPTEGGRHHLVKRGVLYRDLSDSRARGLIPSPSRYIVSLSADSRRAVIIYWQKYVNEALVNHLGGLSLPRSSVVRLTDRPSMTIAVCHGHKSITTPTTRTN